MYDTHKGDLSNDKEKLHNMWKRVFRQRQGGTKIGMLLALSEGDITSLTKANKVALERILTIVKLAVITDVNDVS